MKYLLFIFLFLSGCAMKKLYLFPEDACKQAMSGEWVCEKDE